MRWKRMSIHFAALVALVLMASVVVAQSGAGGAVDDLRVPQYEVRWFALAGGGAGSPMTAGSWSVNSTLGQVAIGRAGSLPNEVCAGFWCAWQPYEIYLPLVLRNY